MKNPSRKRKKPVPPPLAPPEPPAADCVPFTLCVACGAFVYVTSSLGNLQHPHREGNGGPGVPMCPPRKAPVSRIVFPADR